ncbi:leucine-rich repeat transmembrane protein kinase [Actinidia rufa]|uniref:non-specific serine/threonine protein kinase n=1 Tax=Actinidia rufa TaxID=165716 RepID=A0A7J0FKE8_9ERIC|nr:leucine-rich repeat transmembrane protein kinase [Actinidia rufa]
MQERRNQFVEVLVQIEKISNELYNDSDDTPSSLVVNESDLSIRNLGQLHSELRDLQQGKDDRLNHVLDLLKTVHSLCEVLGLDFEKTVTKVHSSLGIDFEGTKSLTNKTIMGQLKGQNLTGTLPAEFASLGYLQEIELSRNYINGSIPTTFAKLPLVNLTLLGNRISGSIPKEIGDIATLEALLLSANNFTGSIPETFSKLENLTDFRIDGSKLSGKIPAFIGSWTKLKRLRISDLNGSGMKFPDLREMKLLKTLILRNCLITGPIPYYIGEFRNLKVLDLSFNMLTGQIPGTLQRFAKHIEVELDHQEIHHKYHANSFCSDVSYNNFGESSSFGCQPSRVNLVSSHSSSNSNVVEWCLKKDLPCSTSPKYHSLFINCGGGTITFEGNKYGEDLATEGPSYFYASSQKWAYSSTGVFMGFRAANYRTDNIFSLNLTGADFYKTARLAPSSLKYYGLCLRKGSYRVRLHFAEIMYSDDQTFSSLGKRIFDVSIQGNVVLKDFNIAEEAKGVGKGITKDFKDVHVYGSTLEIHLYWTGKGTTAIPDRGVYGPLISAITVTPNFDVSTGLSVAAIVGIVVASCVVIVLILFLLLRMKGYLGGKDLEDKGQI